MSRKKITRKGFEGIYYHESPKRRFRGKPDKSYEIIYRNKQGKLVAERIGWLSQGFNAEVAKNLRDKRLREIRHGSDLLNTEMSFETAWEHFEKWILINTKRYCNDQSMYKHHLAHRFARIKLSQISPVDLENLKTDMVAAGKSPQTVKHVLTLVSRIYNKMNDLGLWHGENPVKRVKKPQFDSARIRFLSRSEADTLLADLAKRNMQVHDIALLSIHTGMRLGEIRALRWGSVDMNERIIHIIASGEEDTTKNFTSRDTYMSDDIFEMLKKYERAAGEFVFVNQYGEQLKEAPTTFKRAVNRMFNVGITDRRQRVTFHTLRHTFASWLALQGTPILTIRDLMGHKTLAMTERYAKLIPDARKSAIHKMFTN